VEYNKLIVGMLENYRDTKIDLFRFYRRKPNFLKDFAKHVGEAMTKQYGNQLLVPIEKFCEDIGKSEAMFFIKLLTKVPNVAEFLGESDVIFNILSNMVIGSKTKKFVPLVAEVNALTNKYHLYAKESYDGLGYTIHDMKKEKCNIYLIAVGDEILICTDHCSEENFELAENIKCDLEELIKNKIENDDESKLLYVTGQFQIKKF
jgi:hypothetical protein